MLTAFIEKFKKTFLLALQATGSAIEAYGLPTGKEIEITSTALVTMGNAADMLLSLKYADDDTGTNATAFPYDVPVYVNGERQSADAKAYTVTAATGNFAVEFAVDPILIPAGKYVGISVGASNAANFVTTLNISSKKYSSL